MVEYDELKPGAIFLCRGGWYREVAAVDDQSDLFAGVSYYSGRYIHRIVSDRLQSSLHWFRREAIRKVER